MIHLKPAAEAQDQVQGRFLLDVVVAERTPIFELLPGEDQTLLIRGDAFLVLDLLLHVLDGVAWLHVKGDCFARQSLDEDLHTTTKAQDQVQGRFLLDVVVAERTPIFELLPGEDQTLLIRGDAFLVLDLLLHVLDGVAWLHVKGDCFARQSLDEDLHDSMKDEKVRIETVGTVKVV